MATTPEGVTRAQFVQTVDHVIRERKSAKVLADPYSCSELTPSHAQQVRAALTEIIAIAGWAPFHKIVEDQHLQGDQTSPVPWRFYVLEKPACCALLAYIRQRAAQEPDSLWERAMKKKASRLLAGSSAMIQATWLPDTEQVKGGEPTLRTVEHIAAASAAVQNLMLAAEARGLTSYWSSAGVFRVPEVHQMLGIPAEQRALGSLFFSIDPENYEVLPGALRDKRGSAPDWSSWVTLT